METRVSFPGWEDPLEEGMATHSSILAWRIPIDRGAWQAAVHRVEQSQTRLKPLSSSSNISKYIHLYTYLIVTTLSCRPRTDNFLVSRQQISLFMKQTLKQRGSGSRKHILCFRKLLPNPSTAILQGTANKTQSGDLIFL